MSDHLENLKRALADPQKAGYRVAAEEAAAHQAETGASIRAIAYEVRLVTGWTMQGAEQRIGTLLRWREAGYPGDSPWTYAETKRTTPKSDREARAALRSPERRQQVIARMTPTEKAQVAAAALDDREAAERFARDDSRGARLASQAASKQRAEEDRARREEQDRQAMDAGMTISAYWTKIIGRLNQWGLDFVGIRPHFDGLDGLARERVLAACIELYDELERAIEMLQEQEPEPDVDVIEGKVAKRRLGLSA